MYTDNADNAELPLNENVHVEHCLLDSIIPEPEFRIIWGRT